MEKIRRIRSVRNTHGIKIKRMCATCQYRIVDINGDRFCALSQLKVGQRDVCQKWKMSDGMMNAGLSGGVVRDRVTKEIVME